VITPGKRSQLPEPVEGGVEHRPEPTKIGLWDLRKRLVEHEVDRPLLPLSPELYRALDDLVNWALWRIDRPLTREQIRYQRAFVVRKFIRQYVAQHGTKGSRKYAYREAAKVLTGPYAGSHLTMKDDYLFEERAPGDDPLGVRRREALEQRAREADKKQARRRRGR
jgi:hypothetical protein